MYIYQKVLQTDYVITEKNWWHVCGKLQLWLHAIFVEKLQKAEHFICILIVILDRGYPSVANE